MDEIYNAFARCREVLLDRLKESAPARIQLLTGPRQVGKTTLLLEIAARFGDRAVYAAGDDPDAARPGFWERCWTDAETRAQRETAVLLLDEVHHLSDWAGRLKSHWDRARRRHIPIHVVATGSSALRVATGSRESLAGRFERLTLSHWPASSLADAFHLSPREAAQSLVRFGSYPGAVEFQKDFARWRAYVRDAIIEPAIGRDVLAMGAVRRPALLRQVFAIATGSPAQIVSLQKMQGQLQDSGALETVAHYLALLQDAYLVAPLEKYSAQALRRRASPPKLVVLNNALLSAMHPDGPPDPAREPERFGFWVENACLAFAINQDQQVTYWREEPLEIDAVFNGSWGQWAVEVKTGRYDVQALRGLLEFCRRYPAFKPLVICAPDSEETARRHGISSISWEDFLIEGRPETEQSRRS
ncbi:MAG: ATP-binding protein [Terracidiphilus sp.]|jgi:predicted AAA+ superfamily ATPase